ncbi:DNA primase [Pasteurellaceae bacterium Macca]|nr:DNA primase [Pasteurellaceae bacterium Macca]
MRKLKSAPNLKQQPVGATLTKIYFGSLAWEMAKNPMARNGVEIALSNVLPTGLETVPPVVVSEAVEQSPMAYRLAPKNAQSIELYQMGECEHQGELLAGLCLNLAQNNTAKSIVLYDIAGKLQDDLTNYVERLRQDESSQAIARLAVAKSAKEGGKDQEANKNKPYIDERTEGEIRGLYRVIPKYDKETGELQSERTEWLCDPVSVMGIGRSESEDYLVLEWQPEQSKHKIKEALPLKDLGEREGWKQLKARGLKITTNSGRRNELADYLQKSGNRTLWTITHATGWQNGAYILPNGEIIGTPESPVLFRSQSASFGGYDIQGTLASWQENIAHYAKGNPSMMTAIAVALSAPMIALLEADSFGVHLFGGSTTGKTTTANIASSLYGHPDRTRLSWNATALGLINEASARNDGFLPLDEIGQGASKKHVEMTAYALFNGVGKIQGAKDGGNREMHRWRVMAFSTGEIDLEGYLSQAGIKTNAGQLVRLLNIPINKATDFHGLADGKAHADHLNDASKAHYGVAGREWIAYLSTHRQAVKQAYAPIKQKWLARLPQDTSPQVQRVAARFAILETALHLAQFITQWNAQASSEALLHSFNEWVNVYGYHSKEERQIIEQVNGFLLANAESRFIAYPFDNTQGKIHTIAGYRVIPTETKAEEQEHFYLYQPAFMEAIQGFNKSQACQVLADKGMLKRGKEKGYEFMVKIPHKIDPKRTRSYLITPIYESDSEEETHSPPS